MAKRTISQPQVKKRVRSPHLLIEALCASTATACYSLRVQAEEVTARERINFPKIPFQGTHHRAPCQHSRSRLFDPQ